MVTKKMIFRWSPSQWKFVFSDCWMWIPPPPPSLSCFSENIVCQTLWIRLTLENSLSLSCWKIDDILSGTYYVLGTQIPEVFQLFGVFVTQILKTFTVDFITKLTLLSEWLYFESIGSSSFMSNLCLWDTSSFGLTVTVDF